MPESTTRKPLTHTRQAGKQAAQQQDRDTFVHIARQWLSDQEAAVKPYTQTRHRLKHNF